MRRNRALTGFNNFLEDLQPPKNKYINIAILVESGLLAVNEEGLKRAPHAYQYRDVLSFYWPTFHSGHWKSAFGHQLQEDCWKANEISTQKFIEWLLVWFKDIVLSCLDTYNDHSSSKGMRCWCHWWHSRFSPLHSTPLHTPTLARMSPFVRLFRKLWGSLFSCRSSYPNALHCLHHYWKVTVIDESMNCWIGVSVNP